VESFRLSTSSRKNQFLLVVGSAVLDIDAVGTFTMCLAARPFLAQQQQLQQQQQAGGAGGLIVNISATLHYTAAWYQAHVMAAKVSPGSAPWWLSECSQVACCAARMLPSCC